VNEAARFSARSDQIIISCSADSLISATVYVVAQVADTYLHTVTAGTSEVIPTRLKSSVLKDRQRDQ